MSAKRLAVIVGAGPGLGAARTCSSLVDRCLLIASHTSGLIIMLQSAAHSQRVTPSRSSRAAPDRSRRFVTRSPRLAVPCVPLTACGPRALTSAFSRLRRSLATSRTRHLSSISLTRSRSSSRTMPSTPPSTTSTVRLPRRPLRSFTGTEWVTAQGRSS